MRALVPFRAHEHDPYVAAEDAIRSAALAWLRLVTHDGELPVTREQLANDFVIDGSRFPLVDRGRGIRRPRGGPPPCRS